MDYMMAGTDSVEYLKVKITFLVVAVVVWDGHKVCKHLNRSSLYW